MHIHADFSERVVVTPEQHAWVPSPQAGVERVMLDRVGAERARAASLVRYAPQSVFPAHGHPGGEEILVLAGGLNERDMAYPMHSWLRLPPGFTHDLGAGNTGVTLYLKTGHLARLLP